MANPEHVKIVKQGAEQISQWLEKNPEVRLYLEEAQLSGADLSGADLSRANLSGAYLSGAYLSRANLSWANLSRANLYGADLSGANLSSANCWGTVFTNNDLSDVKGLESIQHHGPSSIGVDTLVKSKGKIPEVFLRGCGVPDELILSIRSLAGKPIQFYTCFISFTDADDTFSERLYNDLQVKGVRCWRWIEDAKWGSTLLQEVDQAIRVYDKLIVILSESSLKAEPVITEIEIAIQKEQEEHKEVLFPIRVDDSVFKWEHYLRAHLKRKYIGDFRNWQDSAKYKDALDRLIRDLRAEKPDQHVKN